MTQSAVVPTISVVMPTLNQAGFIAESVRSVLAQDVPGLELVVADGGSTDGTLDLLADLAAASGGRLRWASSPDSGPADAVNRAVARARAPIVGWLNSDDLYAAGAVQRALAHFDRAPGDVMVYGEADHVDEHGERIDRYPTLPPDTPLEAWRDGCPICQPSAFFRREVFAELGGMDTRLAAAFDYDFWLRLLKRHAGRVGFVDAVQARSRLHAGAITMRMRERVALEGIEVIHRHIGPAPLHWLLTHVDELLASHPFHRQPIRLLPHLQALVDRAADRLEGDAPARFDERLAVHRGVRLAGDRFAAGVYADGWAPEVCRLRLLQSDPAVRCIRLRGRHASPVRGGLHIDVGLPDGAVLRADIPAPGPFVIEVPVDDLRADARLVFRLHTTTAFVPAQVELGSSDRRALAFQLDQVELL